MLNISVLDDLSTFEYVELINDILENCILYVECEMNCVTVCCGCEFLILWKVFEKLVLWYVCGFESVIINYFGAYCIGAWLHNLGGYSSHGLYNLSPGLGYLSQGLRYSSQGHGYTRLLEPEALRWFESGTRLLESRTRFLESRALGTCICIHILWCVWVCCFHDMYIVVLLGELVCIWVLIKKNICIFLSTGFMI